MTDAAAELWEKLYTTANDEEKVVLRVLAWRSRVVWICCGMTHDLSVGRWCWQCKRPRPISLVEALETTPASRAGEAKGGR